MQSCNVQCIADHNMVFLSKDYSMDAYIFGCPVLNGEARKKLEHMGQEVPEMGIVANVTGTYGV